MRRALSGLIGLCLTCSWITAALGVVTVTPLAGTPSTGISVIQDPVTFKWRVTITGRPSTLYQYVIQGNAGDTIEYIRTNFDDSGNPSIDLIRVMQLNIRGAAGTPGIASVEEIDRPGGSGQLRILELVAGSLGRSSSTSDRIRAHIIENVAISGPSHARWEGMAAPSGSPARFTNIQIAGDITAHILHENGFISNFNCDGALSGTTSTPTVISARDASDLITLGAMSNGRIGRDSQVSYMTIGTLNIVGSVSGSGGIFLNSIASARIGADLATPFSLATALPQGSSGSDFRAITIGGSITSSGVINLPTSGAKSQVIINNNVSSGAWNGTVMVGSTTLASPEYSQFAAAIGGGAIGLVPFRLHETDCDPVRNAAIGYCDDIFQIDMRHYGPVTWNPTDGVPFRNGASRHRQYGGLVRPG